MNIYVVGGYVRDKLLGLEPRDADFVVVGSSPEEMIEKGFQQVGKDFPVFIHPITGDEYALARIERKVGVGYEGFECDWKGVTLEQDLERRDLTINAMAQEVVVDDNGDFEIVGNLIDPFGGLIDLTKGYLRETSEAFSEDPLRVLRVARFLARYDNFKISPSLKIMCDKVYYSGELESLFPDRVWMETEKALSEEAPWRYFEFLLKFGIFNEVNMMYGVPQKQEHHPEVEDIHE